MGRGGLKGYQEAFPELPKGVVLKGTSPLQATASVIRMNRNIPDIFSDHQTQLQILQKASQVNVNIFTGQTTLLVTLKSEG